MLITEGIATVESVESDHEARPSPTLRDALERALGESAVRDGVVGPEAGRTTPFGVTPGLVVRPADASAVARALAIVTRHGVGWRAMSAGRNWGYTDALIAVPGEVLFDLRALDRIVRVDEALALAVVEPGVSFGALAHRLAHEHPSLAMDCPGAGPDASIVGNLCERGFGHTTLGDRSRHACDLEVALPSGELVRLGLGDFLEGHARARGTTAHTLGPQLQGLFFQSSLGIVTRATVWLRRRPQRVVGVFARFTGPEAIGAITETVRELRLQGSLTSTAHVFNGMRLLMGRTGYPGEQLSGERALELDPDPSAVAWRRRFYRPGWTLSLSVEGSAAEVRARLRTIERALRRVAGFRWMVRVTPRRLRLAQRLSAWGSLPVLQTARETIASIDVGLDLLQGVPRTEPLRWVQWRAPSVVAGDPRAGEGGLLWVAPLLPATATAAREVVQIGRSVVQAAGFEFQVTFTSVGARTQIATLGIAYARGEPAQVERARECHDRLMNTLLDRGYVPYRAGYRGRELAQARAEHGPALLRRIQDALSRPAADEQRLTSRRRSAGCLATCGERSAARGRR